MKEEAEVREISREGERWRREGVRLDMYSDEMSVRNEYIECKMRG